MPADDDGEQNCYHTEHGEDDVNGAGTMLFQLIDHLGDDVGADFVLDLPHIASSIVHCRGHAGFHTR